MKLVVKIFTLFFLTLLLLTLAVNYFVSRAIKQPFSYLPQTIYQAITHPSLSPNFSFLLLGLDYRDDAFEKTQTTDTIIFGQFNDSNSALSLVSLPRDLWHYPLNLKINKIYPESFTHDSPTRFIKSNFEIVTGQSINRLIVLNTGTLTKLIDLMGGVDVYLDQAYQDDQFPNPQYIANPSPQIPVYISISFPAGWNHIDSSNITFFVRSRKGGESLAQGGTDLGRIHRQQLLLDSLLQKIKTNHAWLQPKTLLGLYQLFHQDFTTDLTDTDILSLIIQLRHHLLNFNLNRVEIPVGTNPRLTPIYDPDKLVYHQWLFLPSDPDYQQLHQFIQSKF